MKAWRLNNMKVGKQSPDRIPHRRSRTYNPQTTPPASDLLLMLFANIKLPVPEAWREGMIAASAETQIL